MNLDKKNKNKWLILFFISGGIFFFTHHQYIKASAIGDIEVRTNLRKIFLVWAMPTLSETQGTLIIRKQSSCPENYTDGEFLYRGNGNSFIDENVEKKVFYCYGVFLSDSLGNNLSMGNSGLVKIKTVREYAQAILGDNIFFASGIFLIIILILLNIIKNKKLQKYQSKELV